MLSKDQYEKIDQLERRSFQRHCEENGWRPSEREEHLLRLGVRRMIVLDIARVGSGQGTGTRDLSRQILSADSDVEIVCGGGITSTEDIRQLQNDGCFGVLIASALHDGRLARSSLADFSIGAAR